MPPKRKFIRSSTIRWSRLEVALLAFLQRMTHRPWGDDVRAAIRLPRFLWLPHLPPPDAPRQWRSVIADDTESHPSGITESRDL